VSARIRSIELSTMFLRIGLDIVNYVTAYLLNSVQVGFIWWGVRALYIMSGGGGGGLRVT